MGTAPTEPPPPNIRYCNPSLRMTAPWAVLGLLGRPIWVCVLVGLFDCWIRPKVIVSSLTNALLWDGCGI